MSPQDKGWSDQDERDFISFFKKATTFAPYPYQIRLALSEKLPQIIRISTGAGKTAAIFLAWLWRRTQASEEIRKATPRRLVYCLPMRVLVEQARDNAVNWLFRLDLLGGRAHVDDAGKEHKVIHYEPTWFAPDKVAVTVLMGGEEADNWDLYPERDSIIMGTQDMLLSRALNRGFGMSRYRWPLHFGQLNNDCLWVIDEVQLMGEGLPTTAQLQAFRDKAGTIGGTNTIWMSATLEPEWLHSVDFDPSKGASKRLSFSESDGATQSLQVRMTARKPLKKAAKSMGDLSIAADILAAHRPGTRTLIVLNTVGRARDLYDAVAKKKPKAKLILLHSRFRPPDRENAFKRAIGAPGPEGAIVISTQVIEAGVDISSRLMFTELAPWPSLVQRFGRCNRTGTEEDPQIFWIDLPEDDATQEKLSPPYGTDLLLQSREILANCQDASPARLPEIPLSHKESQLLRYKDIVELFDTTPDISGQDIDISRFIRDNPETDVQVFWRDLPADGPEPYEKYPGRDELCPVPIKDLRELLTKRRTDIWAPDPLDGTWLKLDNTSHIHPGMTILLPSSAGRYSHTTGWALECADPVPPVPPPEKKDSNTYGEDTLSQNKWASLTGHTDAVVATMQAIVSEIVDTARWRAALEEAALWHDAGKAHPTFQAKLDPDKLKDFPARPAAKAPKDAWLAPVKSDSPRDTVRRPFFRHELVSGLLALQAGKGDLTAYLAAAHHGKVRLSIRSLPEEWKPPETGLRFARGVWENDELPAITLGGSVTIPPSKINLGYMDLGDSPSGPSWTSRAISLRDRNDLGIFRLGFLEALIKAADERASGGLP